MRLLQASLIAHERALKYGGLVPAERDEFMHLPMTRVGGVPVFDATRMRPDQIEETTERLEALTGRADRYSVRDMVVGFMEAYGRFGQRVSDICEETGASKPIVLRYLRDLVDAGLVVVKEETTRGAGSKRKRYVWIGNEMNFEDLYEDVEGLTVIADNWKGQKHGPAVVHHGSSVGRLQGCRCGGCTQALEDELVGEVRSAARRAGGSGFRVGLDLRARRRVAAQAEFERVLAIGQAGRGTR